MPRNRAENQLYIDLPYPSGHYTTWLDITWSSNRWVYRDGSPASWFNWNRGEPNGIQRGEHNIELIGHEPIIGFWNDNYIRSTVTRTVVCTYSLSVNAVNVCPWLRDFADSQ